MNDRSKLSEIVFSQLELIRRNFVMDKLPVDVPGMPTPAQTQALFFIVENKLETVRDIASTMNISSSAATQLVDGLVNDGFVNRYESPEDRRITVLKPTKKAIKISQKIQKHIKQVVLEMTKTLSEEELKQLINIHQKMLDQLIEMRGQKQS